MLFVHKCNQRPNSLIRHGWVSQELFGMNRIVVPPALPYRIQIAGDPKLIHNLLNSSLGNVNCRRKIPHPHVTLSRNEKKHMKVIRQKCKSTLTFGPYKNLLVHN